MERDEHVIVLGEDIGIYGGAFGVTDGLLAQFGASRVRDTPISEAAITGCAIGAALTGLRPVLEIQFMDFITLAMEQRVLQAAKMRYMFGGKVQVPMVVRTPGGSGTGAAAQHSESLEAWLAHVPGLKSSLLRRPRMRKGCSLQAFGTIIPRSSSNTNFSIGPKDRFPRRPSRSRVGLADVKRVGTDVTVIATSVMVARALAAAQRLAVEGISVDVVDPRTLNPLDVDTLAASVHKTGRVVVVYEAVKTLGIGAEIAARLAEGEAFYYLQAPILRLGGAECPMPYNRTLERAAVPQEEDIIGAVRQVLQT